MLTGIVFLLALIGVFVVVIWEIANDRVGWTEQTRGLLRMRSAGQPRDGEATAAPAGEATAATQPIEPHS